MAVRGGSRRVGALFCCVGIAISGCASTDTTSQWRPQIDQSDVDSAAYEQDLEECRAYAEANPDADVEQARKDGMLAGGLLTGGAVAGTVVGGVAAVGAVAAAPIVLPIAALVGGTAWMAGEANKGQAEMNYRNIVSACLSGRGYRVIDAGTGRSSGFF